MGFNIGDKVIHWTYGLGEIAQIDEKPINGHPTDCYVFQTPNMSVWVPIDQLQQRSLRTPTPPNEFIKLFAILKSPGEQLPEDRVLRKNQLMNQMHEGELASICKVVRDLTHYKRVNKLNDQEKSILERAEKSLLTEWTFSLGVTMSQAEEALRSLLGE